MVPELPLSWPRKLALGVVVVAALSVLLRLPATTSGLRAEAKKNDAYSGLGRTFAAADSLDIDNTFVAAASDTLPRGATYAVALPPPDAVADGRMSEITYDAVAPFMRYLLLPDRQVALARAQYVLCYGCSLSETRFRPLWSAGDGAKIAGEKIAVRRSH